MTQAVDNPDPNRQDSLSWRDGVPIATAFDDPYYSLDDGLAETQHVFLAGNDLPSRFQDGFHIAELGFGTGLNLAASLLSWRNAGVQGQLYFTTFEAYPLSHAQIIRALGVFPDVSAVVADLKSNLGQTEFETDYLRFRMIKGDARSTLPAWDGAADAWFLDGFSPARNPELWEDDLMGAVGQHTSPQGTFATYTAAGHVRRALSHAGFRVDRIPGYGRKRHMTKGVMV